MLLALAICRNDFLQAERLVRWIAFLSLQKKCSLKEETLLLIATEGVSSDDRFWRMIEICELTFGFTIPMTAPERGVGWPGGANDMMKTALIAASAHNEPVFFLEPDGIPLYATWFQVIQRAYRDCGKPFMGGYVPTPPPHMTGIAVYPADWERYCPLLTQVPDSAGWDTYCADGIYPYAHFTPLIQHVFRRHEPGWSIPGLNALDKRAAVFHQDKHGKLIRLLDQTLFDGECSRHPTFGYSLSGENEKIMATKFYLAINATRAITGQGGKRFVFELVEPMGGSRPGVFATDVLSEQIALEDVVQNPATGVSEITQQEWEQLTKKKWALPASTILRPSIETLPPQAPINLAPSGRAAAVVEARDSSGSDPSAPAGLSQIKDINDVLKLGKVEPSQPYPTGAMPKKAHSKIPRKPNV